IAKEGVKTDSRVELACRVVQKCLIAKGAVAPAVTCGIGKSLKTDCRTGTELLDAHRPGCKTVKRLITHSSVGTGNGVALKCLPPNSDIWADIQPLDISQRAASGVVQERPRANRRIS